jgi:hypothetical protein
LDTDLALHDFALRVLQLLEANATNTQALAHITTQNAIAWFAHCGYSIQ